MVMLAWLLESATGLPQLTPFSTNCTVPVGSLPWASSTVAVTFTDSPCAVAVFDAARETLVRASYVIWTSGVLFESGVMATPDVSVFAQEEPAPPPPPPPSAKLKLSPPAPPPPPPK